MTVLVVNHGIIKSISILTMVVRSMMKSDVDTASACFCRELQVIQANFKLVSTHSALDLDRVHNLPHALLQEKILFISRKGINEFQTLFVGFKVVEII
jgi:hypothetical protein